MNLHVIPNKKIWLSISTVLVIAGISLVSIFRLEMGIDFTGGTLMEVEINKTVTTTEISEAVSRGASRAQEMQDAGESIEIPVGGTNDEATEDASTETEANEEVPTETATEESEGEGVFTAEEEPANPLEELTEAEEETVVEEALTEYSELNPEGTIDIGTPIVQSSGANTFIIRIKYIDEATHQIILQSLQELNDGVAVEELRYENIGPVIGETLKKNALISLGLAVLFIILFITFAFRKMPQTVSSFKFGLTAVVALVHDVIVIVGVYALLGYFLNVEVDTLFVTALLTVMGFSVHDTIVVFDRVRENLFRSRGRTFGEIANDSINQTLARSINTSVTTLITLIALFILGGASIKWFVFALIIGILIGTYSSIFLATPLLVVWHKKKQ